jgi:cyclopropane fatty-acyl-phospholipid synthase-like methyltransferase
MLNLIRKFSSRLFFNLFYLQSPPWDTGVSPPELMDFIQTHPPGRALDLGCGTGTNVLTLAQHGWQASGVDFVPRAIRAARRKLRHAGVEAVVKVGDVSSPASFSGRYDLILDIGCYHSLSPAQRNSYRQMVSRHLAAGGSYLLYGFLSEDGSKIGPEDVAAFESLLDLYRRENGEDNNRAVSAWFWFRPRTGAA